MYPSRTFPLVCAEELNLAYCAVPKVACTGWKMWLRTMLGLPEPLNQYLAHSYEKSGLGDLSKSFQEEHAVRLMTKPDMFKVPPWCPFPFRPSPPSSLPAPTAVSAAAPPAH